MKAASKSQKSVKSMKAAASDVRHQAALKAWVTIKANRAAAELAAKKPAAKKSRKSA